MYPLSDNFCTGNASAIATCLYHFPAWTENCTVSCVTILNSDRITYNYPDTRVPWYVPECICKTLPVLLLVLLREIKLGKFMTKLPFLPQMKSTNAGSVTENIVLYHSQTNGLSELTLLRTKEHKFNEGENGASITLARAVMILGEWGCLQRIAVA